jgi:hypothetical protein
VYDAASKRLGRLPIVLATVKLFAAPNTIAWEDQITPYLAGTQEKLVDDKLPMGKCRGISPTVTSLG